MPAEKPRPLYVLHEDWTGPNPQVRRSRPAADRFWEKVDKAGPLPPFAPHLGPCWMWTGAGSHRERDAYGRFNLPGGVMVTAHRWAYEAMVGPVPDGLELDHLCRVPSCIRPSHLEIVTRGVNNSRAKRAQTRCLHGHSLEDAAIRKTDGARLCRTCKRINSAAEYLRRKAKRSSGG